MRRTFLAQRQPDPATEAALTTLAAVDTQIIKLQGIAGGLDEVHAAADAGHQRLQDQLDELRRLVAEHGDTLDEARRDLADLDTLTRATARSAADATTAADVATRQAAAARTAADHATTSATQAAAKADTAAATASEAATKATAADNRSAANATAITALQQRAVHQRLGLLDVPLLALGATVDRTITWTSPMPTATYGLDITPVSSVLLGKITATVKAQTTTGVTITLRATAAVTVVGTVLVAATTLG